MADAAAVAVESKHTFTLNHPAGVYLRVVVEALNGDPGLTRDVADQVAQAVEDHLWRMTAPPEGHSGNVIDFRRGA